MERSDAVCGEFYSHGPELEAAPRLNYKIAGTCRRFNTAMSEIGVLLFNT
jgi:hypothetical protein